MGTVFYCSPFAWGHHRLEERDYYCGPATMEMIGSIGGYNVSQTTWANNQHLRTDAQGESAVGDMVRQINERTNLPARKWAKGNYALRRIENKADYYLWHVARIGFGYGR